MLRQIPILEMKIWKGNKNQSIVNIDRKFGVYNFELYLSPGQVISMYSNQKISKRDQIWQFLPFWLRRHYQVQNWRIMKKTEKESSSDRNRLGMFMITNVWQKYCIYLFGFWLSPYSLSLLFTFLLYDTIANLFFDKNKNGKLANIRGWLRWPNQDDRIYCQNHRNIYSLLRNVYSPLPFSVMLQGGFWSSLFGQVNNPQIYSQASNSMVLW